MNAWLGDRRCYRVHDFVYATGCIPENIRERVGGGLVGFAHNYMQWGWLAHWHLPIERGRGDEGPYLCAVFEWAIPQPHLSFRGNHLWRGLKLCPRRVGSDDVQQSVLVDAVEVVDYPQGVEAQFLGWSRMRLCLVDKGSRPCREVSELSRCVLLVPTLIARDREPVLIPGLMVVAENELPGEVVKGGPEVMHDLAHGDRPPWRDAPAHVNALDVFGSVLVRFDAESITIQPGLKPAIAGLNPLYLGLDAPESYSQRPIIECGHGLPLEDDGGQAEGPGDRADAQGHNRTGAEAS
jgi:hypothetical protein